MFSSSLQIRTFQGDFFCDQDKAQGSGAEFLLPWLIDSYFCSISSIKNQFTANELKVLINSGKNATDDNIFNSEAFLADMKACCLKELVHKRYGILLDDLEKKLRRLNEQQTHMLILWIKAFWKGSSAPLNNLEKYVAMPQQGRNLDANQPQVR